MSSMAESGTIADIQVSVRQITQQATCSQKNTDLYLFIYWFEVEIIHGIDL